MHPRAGPGETHGRQHCGHLSPGECPDDRCVSRECPRGFRAGPRAVRDVLPDRSVSALKRCQTTSASKRSIAQNEKVSSAWFTVLLFYLDPFLRSLAIAKPAFEEAGGEKH